LQHVTAALGEILFNRCEVFEDKLDSFEDLFDKRDEVMSV